MNFPKSPLRELSVVEIIPHRTYNDKKEIVAREFARVVDPHVPTDAVQIMSGGVTVVEHKVTMPDGTVVRQHVRSEETVVTRPVGHYVKTDKGLFHEESLELVYE